MPPVLDTVVAAAGGITAAAFAASNPCRPNEFCIDESISRYTAIVVGGAAAIIYGLSAWYGFAKTAKCRDAKLAKAERACTGVDRTACEWLRRPTSPDPKPN